MPANGQGAGRLELTGALTLSPFDGDVNQKWLLPCQTPRKIVTICSASVGGSALAEDRTRSRNHRKHNGCWFQRRCPGQSSRHRTHSVLCFPNTMGHCVAAPVRQLDSHTRHVPRLEHRDVTGIWALRLDSWRAGSHRGWNRSKHSFLPPSASPAVVIVPRTHGQGQCTAADGASKLCTCVARIPRQCLQTSYDTCQSTSVHCKLTCIITSS